MVPSTLDMGPTFLDFRIVSNIRHGPMSKPQARDAVLVSKSILHVRDFRIGHEQVAIDFKERRQLDGLYVSPQVASVVSSLAKPTSTGLCLQNHQNCSGIGRLIGRPHLFEDGFKH